MFSLTEKVRTDMKSSNCPCPKALTSFFILVCLDLLGTKQMMTVPHCDKHQELRFGLFPHCYKARDSFATAEFKSPSLYWLLDYFCGKTKFKSFLCLIQNKVWKTFLTAPLFNGTSVCGLICISFLRIENGPLQWSNYLCNTVHNGLQIAALFQSIHILENINLKKKSGMLQNLLQSLVNHTVKTPFPWSESACL